jgi:hypothetical protein
VSLAVSEMTPTRHELPVLFFANTAIILLSQKKSLHRLPKKMAKYVKPPHARPS